MTKEIATGQLPLQLPSAANPPDVSEPHAATVTVLPDLRLWRVRREAIERVRAARIFSLLPRDDAS